MQASERRKAIAGTRTAHVVENSAKAAELPDLLSESESESDEDSDEADDGKVSKEKSPPFTISDKLKILDKFKADGTLFFVCLL